MREDGEMAKEREIWVDNVKVIACILVVLGHFFQSMTESELLPRNDLYRWFIQTVYYFHVPLFFICSGYLYQKLTKIASFQDWGLNVLKKLLALGIPYLVFSILTWGFKTLFSDSVNTEIGGLVDILFVHPTAPYWYLYALFFIFLITPTFRNTLMGCIILGIAIVFKILSIAGGGYGISVLNYILSYEIWFVFLMCINHFSLNKYLIKYKLLILLPIFLVLLFIGLSVLVYFLQIEHGSISFALGLMACCSVVMLMVMVFGKGQQVFPFGLLAKYTMPLYLMHTMFAAALRILLFKIGIVNPIVHVLLGLFVTFAGPILAGFIMKKTKWLEFILYPGKFIKIKTKREPVNEGSGITASETSADTSTDK